MQYLSKVLSTVKANLNHLGTAVHTADTHIMQKLKIELLRSRHAIVASTRTCAIYQQVLSQA
jgi:hypothetical protein